MLLLLVTGLLWPSWWKLLEAWWWALQDLRWLLLLLLGLWARFMLLWVRNASEEGLIVESGWALLSLALGSALTH